MRDEFNEFPADVEKDAVRIGEMILKDHRELEKDLQIMRHLL